MRIMIAALALAVVAAPSVAGSPPALPGAADPSRVPAGTYAIDSAHTQASFTVDHFGFSPFSGQLGGVTGTLAIDPARPGDAKVDVTFDMNAISTTVPALTTHLKSADFFDVANHPTARFVSTSVSANGTSAKIHGNLTLRGVTRPVTLDAQFHGAGINPMSKKLNFGFQAATTIKRSDFGVSAVIPAVSDDVALAINVAFAPQ